MAINQKAVKVINKILDAGFTDEKAISAMTIGRYSFYPGHYRGGHCAHQ